MLCDDQAGSKDLYPYLKAIMPGLVIPTRIDPPFGDMAWMGNGPDGELRVGVEYKKIDELLTSMIDGRVVKQIRGMLLHYDRRYLLIEGRIRCDRNTGIMQKQQGDRWRDIDRGGKGYTYSELEHWYTTIEEQTQTRVKQTFDEYESARWLKMKHSWWTNKDWNDHAAMNQFHVPPPPIATFENPSLLRRIAKELPAIGWDKSILIAGGYINNVRVEGKFKSVREMVNANEQTWQQIDGIGKTIARKIVNDLNGVNR